MRRARTLARLAFAGLRIGVMLLALPAAALAHPMGNFSISHYAAIRVLPGAAELRYVVDLAEIPTFQEIQDSGIVAENGHASLAAYLARRAEALARGLALELNGRPLALEADARDILFTPGAGDLPTMKLGVVYRARFDGPLRPDSNRLLYRDTNFPGRAGWKEIVAVAAAGIAVVETSVPEADRSHQLTDYPTDLLNSPPQILDASLVFAPGPAFPAIAAVDAGPPALAGAHRSGARRHETAAPAAAVPPALAGVGRTNADVVPRDASPPAAGARAGSDAAFTHASPAAGPRSPGDEPATAGTARALEHPVARRDGPTLTAVALAPNRQASRGDAFSRLVARPESSVGFLLVAALVAASLGAFHALEPGHGKTVVAAYLVGSRGTARHAMLLGLVVTASHTAGVYVLGAVTLYASRYVLPERLYPWLGAVSGLIIAGLGAVLFLRRYTGVPDHHHHGHAHAPGGHHTHGHPTTDGLEHEHHEHVHHDHPHHEHPHHEHAHSHGHGHHHPSPGGAVSLRELLALGVTGGIVPCPAALVVLLSAVALHRIGFGLFLIVAFSAGLAAVLIAIGLLMVYARRLMSRFRSEGPLITRWLPLTSSAVIAAIGVAVAVQALAAGGILEIRLG